VIVLLTGQYSLVGDSSRIDRHTNRLLFFIMQPFIVNKLPAPTSHGCNADTKFFSAILCMGIDLKTFPLNYSIYLKKLIKICFVVLKI
jgi:hypothetical protein